MNDFHSMFCPIQFLASFRTPHLIGSLSDTRPASLIDLGTAGDSRSGVPCRIGFVIVLFCVSRSDHRIYSHAPHWPARHLPIEMDSSNSFCSKHSKTKLYPPSGSCLRTDSVTLFRQASLGSRTKPTWTLYVDSLFSNRLAPARLFGCVGTPNASLQRASRTGPRIRLPGASRSINRIGAFAFHFRAHWTRRRAKEATRGEPSNGNGFCNTVNRAG